MSEGGTSAARLERADKELQAELDTWNELKINPNGWRMGDSELLFRCEILVLMDVIKEKLGVTDDELNIRLKQVLTRQLAELRPHVVEQRRREIQAALIQGIRPQI